MSDCGCIKEHLPKTLGQTIHQSMAWDLLITATAAVSFGAKAHGQEEDSFGAILHVRGVGLWQSLSC